MFKSVLKPRVVSARFGIWGPSGAGKTTLLIALVSAFSQQASDKTKKNQPAWVMTASDSDTQNFITNHVSDFAMGFFPPATDIGQPQILKFSLVHEKEGRYDLALMDVAGELIKDHYDDREYFEELRKCDGILMLLKGGPYEASPSSGLRPHAAEVTILTDQLAQTERANEIALAMCVTQLDREEVWTNPELHTGTPQYVRDNLIGPLEYDRLNCICPTNHVFKISSVGRYGGALGDARSNTKMVELPNGELRLEIENVNRWQPYRIHFPFLWLIHQLGGT